MTNGSGSIRSALKPPTTKTQSTSSIKQFEYPVDQNPFGEEGEIVKDNNCTITSKQNNPTNSPPSVKSLKNEINNFQPSSGSSSNNTSNEYKF